jgi:hypothetical protein
MRARPGRWEGALTRQGVGTRECLGGNQSEDVAAPQRLQQRVSVCWHGTPPCQCCGGIGVCTVPDDATGHCRPASILYLFSMGPLKGRAAFRTQNGSKPDKPTLDLEVLNAAPAESGRRRPALRLLGCERVSPQCGMLMAAG